MASFSIIPYVCGAGASTPGAEGAAAYCFEHNLSGDLAGAGISVRWAFDPRIHWSGPYGQSAHASLPPRGSAGRNEIVFWHSQSLAQNVEKELREGRRVVTIGGDHSMAAGSITGFARAFGPGARIGLIWVDAHADINTVSTSSSKALHGMPVAALLGLDPALQGLGPAAAVVRPEDIVYAGLRDIDPGEIDNARGAGIPLQNIADLRAMGVARTLQEQAMQLASRCDHIALSIDVDAFDPEFCPATGTPVAGGFTPDEILPVLSGIVRTHGIEMIEVVEFNPALAGADRTYGLVRRILLDLLPAQNG